MNLVPYILSLWRNCSWAVITEDSSEQILLGFCTLHFLVLQYKKAVHLSVEGFISYGLVL